MNRDDNQPVSVSTGGGRTIEPEPRWEAFAAREPYFAVLTAPRFLRAHLTPAHEREFFDSGDALVDAIFRTIELRLAPHFAPASILEYGCGVGRLAIPFARRAGRQDGSVVAVDRSPAMLEVARREARRHGVTNIDFLEPAAFLSERRTFNLVNCYLVFQRLPPSEGLALFRELVGRIESGGFGVFQFPYRTTTTRVLDASRWLRERAPAINGLANLLRGKPFGEPYIAGHTCDLDEVFRILEDASIAATHVVFEQHESLASAIVFVEMPMRLTAAGHEPPERVAQTVADADQTINVREVIADTSIDELNRTAEEYFASLTDAEHHLTKPFSKPEETPALLTSVATVLQGLRLTPGATVLEFGAGTGWLSRFLTQLGCRVILLDVSPTALRMAREVYERLPVIGDRPAPEFLQFDGRQIGLPDASVDRILTFDAFHHAPNPDAMIGEFARILKPGGIAGFAEPGPRHSRSPMSQFEMRTYGVVENDVDVHAIWRTARRSGFADMKLAVFHGLPFHVSLEEYEDFLSGGATSARWVNSARVFLRGVRSFFLFKAGSERADSRTASGLACEIHATLASAPAVEGQPVLIDAIVTNSGAAVWLPPDAPHGGVSLGGHLYDASGALIAFGVPCGRVTEPPREIAPGETVRVRASLPPQRAGRYRLELDCVASRVTWFAQIGAHPATLHVEVVAAHV